MGKILGSGARGEVAVGVVASGQLDETYVQSRLVEALKKIVGGILASLVLILIEGDVDTAIWVFVQLDQLRRSQVGTDGTSGVAESCLPQHGEIEQALDQYYVAELSDRFPGKQAAFRTGQEAMREGIANAAAIQVDDVILLTTREDHAAAKSIGALRTNQARFEQTFQGVAEGLQVRAQVAAAGIADAEFLDDPGIVHPALREILDAFRITVQFELIEGGRMREQLGSGGEFFLEIGDALAKREMTRQFDKANQVAATPAAVTVEKVFSDVDVEGGMPVLMQRTEFRELSAAIDPMSFLVVLLQVLQQRNTLFEPFEILAHGVRSAPSVKV